MESELEKFLKNTDKHLELLAELEKLFEKLHEATKSFDFAKGVCEAVAWSDDEAIQHYRDTANAVIRTSREITKLEGDDYGN